MSHAGRLFDAMFMSLSRYLTIALPENKSLKTRGMQCTLELAQWSMQYCTMWSGIIKNVCYVYILCIIGIAGDGHTIHNL